MSDVHLGEEPGRFEGSYKNIEELKEPKSPVAARHHHGRYADDDDFDDLGQ